MSDMTDDSNADEIILSLDLFLNKIRSWPVYAIVSRFLED